MLVCIILETGGYYNIINGDVSLITLNYTISSLLESLSIVGVNCFVLISGYFLVNGKFKLKKVLNLYLVTIFYSILLFIPHCILYGFSLLNFIKSCLPLLMGTYWFITTYVVLYLLSPFLNILIKNLSKKQYLIFLGILIGVFSLWRSLIPFADSTIIGTGGGYSIIWFIVLYFIGAYINLYGVNLFKKNVFNLLSYFIIACLIVASKFIMIFISTKIIKISEGQNHYYNYDSISVLIESVFLFVFFKRLNINSNIISKITTFLVPSVFSVYLISDNFQWRKILWNNWLKADQFVNSNYFILHYIGCVLLVFICCIGIDLIRIGIFYIFSNKIFKRKNNKIMPKQI